MDRFSLLNSIVVIGAASVAIGLGLWAFKFYPLESFLLGTGVLTLFGASALGYGVIAAYRRGPALVAILFGLTMILLLVTGGYLVTFVVSGF